MQFARNKGASGSGEDSRSFGTLNGVIVDRHDAEGLSHFVEETGEQGFPVRSRQPMSILRSAPAITNDDALVSESDLTLNARTPRIHSVWSRGVQQTLEHLNRQTLEAFESSARRADPPRCTSPGAPQAA